MKFLIPCCVIAAMATVSLLSSTASAQLFGRHSALSQRYSPPAQRYSAPSPFSVAPYNNSRYRTPNSAPNYSSSGARFTPTAYPAPRQNNFGQSYSRPSYSNESQAGPTLVPTPADSSRPAYSQNYAAQPQTYSKPRKS